MSLHGAGVGHQRLEAGVERDGHLVDADAPSREDPTEQLRQAMPLADGDGRHRCRGVEPVAPGKPTRGGGHPQEGRARDLLDR